MKNNPLINATLTCLLVIFSITQAHAGLFDRLKERLQKQQEPVTETIDIDNYSDQAGILTSSLIKLAPLMQGKAQTGQLSSDLNLDPTSMGIELGSEGIKIIDGLEISLSGISINPAGIKLTVHMDNFQVMRVSDLTSDVYANGKLDVVIGYQPLKQNIVLKLDNGAHGSVTYSGGRVDGTEVAFEDVTIIISTKQILLPWEEQYTVNGVVYVNNVAIPLESLIRAIELLANQI